MSDVWDLTQKDQGDHVLVALTPGECHITIAALAHAEARLGRVDDKATANRVATELRRCLRDQKDIDA